MSEIKPSLRTPFEDLSPTERVKESANGLSSLVVDINSPMNLSYQFRDSSFDDLAEAAESLAKSYGIYLEFNRALTGSQKDWIFMLRITVPGGGPLTREQWDILDDVSSRYARSDSYTGTNQGSLRITTRQNIQLHWIKKKDLVDTIQHIAKSGFYTLNGCGDNVRNTIGCPLSNYSKIFNANSWAQRVGKYFELPLSAYLQVFAIDPSYLRQVNEPLSVGGNSNFEYGRNLLNRKFKIAFSAIHLDEETGAFEPDNCVELRTNDIGVAPIFENESVSRFQVYVGGSQGERNGISSFAALGQPLGIFRKSDLISGLDAIVRLHKEWGDRKNRHWARLKYVLYKMGIEWFRKQVREKSGVDFDLPEIELDNGARMLHHGWKMQDSDRGLWCYGAFIENGRIIDGPNGKLKSMVRHLMDNYEVELLTTPNQDIIFGNVSEGEKGKFEADMIKFGYGKRNDGQISTLRRLSGGCVGLNTCRLAYTDSERFEPYLIDALESKWGEMAESIGITGCERQCFRPGTKTIGWVGSGSNLYCLKIGGSEDARYLGGPLMDPETKEIYLRNVPREKVALVTDALFQFYASNKELGEKMGYFFRRVGARAIIDWLKKNETTASLMLRKSKIPLALKPELVNPSLHS